jgi:hypothetical protein
MRKELEFVEVTGVTQESDSDDIRTLDDQAIESLGGGLQEDLPGPSK